MGVKFRRRFTLEDDDAHMRQTILTAGEGAAIATVADIGIKATFGRLRPIQDAHSHTWFRGGQSFVSGEVTSMFALAAGISGTFDNEWYVAGPVYSLALLDGFGRIGHDAHWLSDVVGAGLLGWGSTELLLYLHAKHAGEPSRWRIFPMAAPADSATSRRRDTALAGIGVGYEW